ncbi:MAG: hypothetical protein DRJ52_09870 [Thermoprotei archaeon]|nr:MAG: hypothetical protein DRJ52_09870 [Thermoprotei archaeon]
MVRLVKQFTALILSLAFLSYAIVLADPIFITIYNQENEPITEKCVVVAGNTTLEMYNATHAYIDANTTLLVKIYVRNVLVKEFWAEPGKAYRLKVKVGRLVLRLPKDVKAYVTVLASGETIEAHSFESDTVVVPNVPYGLIKVKVVGAITEERVFNLQGGVIEVREYTYIKWRELLPWLTLSLIPVIGYSAYSYAKKPRLRQLQKLEQKQALLQKPAPSKPIKPKPKLLKLPKIEEEEKAGRFLSRKDRKQQKPVVKYDKFLSIADILDQLEEC